MAIPQSHTAAIVIITERDQSGVWCRCPLPSLSVVSGHLCSLWQLCSFEWVFFFQLCEWSMGPSSSSPAPTRQPLSTVSCISSHSWRNSGLRSGKELLELICHMDTCGVFIYSRRAVSEMSFTNHSQLLRNSAFPVNPCEWSQLLQRELENVYWCQHQSVPEPES